MNLQSLPSLALRLLFLALFIHVNYTSTAQDPGCIGFGSNPQNCTVGCGREAFLCPGIDSLLIRECDPGDCPSGNLSYCWFRKRPGENDFTQIPGATGKEYLMTGVDLEGKTGMFIFRRALACGNSCQGSDYDSVTVHVSDLKLTLTASPSEVCKGKSSSLEAMVTGGIPPYNYLWSNNLGPVSKHTVNPDTTTTYAVTIGDSTNCVLSTTVKVNVFPISVGGFVNGGNDSICVGGNTGMMQLNGQTGGVQFWQSRRNNGAWTKIPSGKNSHAQDIDLEGEWEFRAVVQSGPCDSTFSSIRKVVVVDKPLAPDLVKGLPDNTVCAGARLTAVVSGGSGGLGTCANETFGSHPQSPWFPIANPVDSGFLAVAQGTNALHALRRCTVSGCTSKDTTRVLWQVVSDPTVTIQPTAPELVCFEGSSGPISLSAAGGTPALQYSWQFEDPSSGWVDVMDDNPSNAQYAGKDKSNGFTVNGIDVADTYRFRAKVSASGKGCDATFSQPVEITWRPELNGEFAPDPKVDKQVGQAWKFSLKDPPPANSLSTLLMYNKGLLAATWSFGGADTTIILPQTAQGEATRFCLNRKFLPDPTCITAEICGPNYEIFPPDDLSVKLTTTATESIVCPNASTSFLLSWTPDNSVGCNSKLISKHTLTILGTTYSDSVVQGISGDKFTYNIPAGTLQPGLYIAQGCVYQTCENQNILVGCAEYTFRQLPAQLFPDYIARDSNGLDLDTTDQIICPNSYYRLDGKQILDLGNATILASNFSFDKNGFTTGSSSSLLSIPLTFRVSGNCLYKDTLELTTRPAYDLETDHILCVGDSITLSIDTAFSMVTWDSAGMAFATGREFPFSAIDKAVSYQTAIRLRAERDGCAYRDTVLMDVVKVSGKLEAWPDSACADGIYRVMLNDGVIVEGATYPPGWVVKTWSPHLYQTLSRPFADSLVIRLKAQDLECRDNIAISLPPLTQAINTIDSLYHDRCAATVLVPEGCPSGMGTWYRIHRITGKLDTLSELASAYWRNVSDANAADHLYVFQCSTPCAQVAGLRESGVPNEPPCADQEATVLKIIPNPTSGNAFLEFQCPSPGSIRLRWMDITGRILKETQVAHPGGKQAYALTMDDLPSGVYFLEIRNPAGQSRIEKIILHR